MPILKGGLSVRRYVVQGEISDGWQERYIEALENNAFREPLTQTKKEESAGWVQIHNLLDTSFLDINRWLYNQYAIFALRVDKKVIPANYFRAHFQKRQETWCQQNNRERCPPTVREELKETLEFELLQKTLPRVTCFEVVWNMSEGWVLFHNDSELPNDRFQKLFLRTFNLKTTPWLPTDALGDAPEMAEALWSSGATDLRVEAT